MLMRGILVPKFLKFFDTIKGDTEKVLGKNNFSSHCNCHFFSRYVFTAEGIVCFHRPKDSHMCSLNWLSPTRYQQLPFLFHIRHIQPYPCSSCINVHTHSGHCGGTTQLSAVVSCLLSRRVAGECCAHVIGHLLAWRSLLEVFAPPPPIQSCFWFYIMPACAWIYGCMNRCSIVTWMQGWLASMSERVGA